MAPALGAPLAPYIVARVPHRTVLILSDLLRIGFVLSLLLVDKPRELWLLYTFLSAQGLLSGIFHPVRLAILPDVVANETELGAATGFSQLDGHDCPGYRLGRCGYNLSGYPGFHSHRCFYLPPFCSTAFATETPAFPGQSKSGRNPHQSEGYQPATFVDLLKFLRQDKDFLWLVLKKTLMATFSYNPVQALHILLSKLYPHIGPGSLLLGVILSVGGFVSFFSPTVVRLFTVNNHSRIRKATLLDYFASALRIIVQGVISPFALLLVGLALSVLWGKG